jgi:F-box/WD-40 domain protein MET30
MERFQSPSIHHGRPPLPAHNGIDPPTDDADRAPLTDRSSPRYKSAPVLEREEDDNDRTVDTAKNCTRLRPEEESRRRPRDSMTNMSSSLIGKTVAPFLKEHIPSLYAPVGKSRNEQSAREKNPNTKYCYRHRPDSKCRRSADEAKMVMIQQELDKLTSADQQAITHVWSLFSAAPSRHRELMLQGVLAQLCFPQLSLVSREVGEALKIDFIAALPVEIAQKVLCFLDTVSLTKAAQVSQRWRLLADDDAVWVRMCEQHVNRKCTKCGWGLPLLERKKLRNYTRARQLAKDNSNGRIQELPENTNGRIQELPDSSRTESQAPSLGKRQSESTDGPDSKRQCVVKQSEEEPKTRSWKAVYRDRWQVSILGIFLGQVNANTLSGRVQLEVRAMFSQDAERPYERRDLSPTGRQHPRHRVVRCHHQDLYVACKLP